MSYENGPPTIGLSDIPASIIDRKLIIVSMSMFSGSRNPHNIWQFYCTRQLFFNIIPIHYAIVLHYFNNAARYNDTSVFVLCSCVSLYSVLSNCIALV